MVKLFPQNVHVCVMCVCVCVCVCVYLCTWYVSEYVFKLLSISILFLHVL